MTGIWVELQLPASGAPYNVRDIWARYEQGEERGALEIGYVAAVPKHGVAMLRISGSTCH